MTAARTLTLVLVLAHALAHNARAHHSFAGFYDQLNIIEIEGTIKKLSWRNPHGSIVLEVTADNGDVQEWQIETGSISVLRIRGHDNDFVQVGDRVRIAGEASLRQSNGLYARNMLLPSGEEVLLSIGIAPRWTDPNTGRLLEPQFDTAAVDSARRSARGIFRVWSTVLDDPESFPLFKGDYPLTDVAAKIKAEWDPGNVVLLGCDPKGMPSIMISPYPVEFVDEGDRIVMRFEEDNAVRTIHLTDDDFATESKPSLLGYSRGRWEGDELVVETANIDAAYLDSDGTPQSPGVRLIERFILNEAQDRLDYRIDIEDSSMFTETFTLTRYWVWRPDQQIHEYECIVPDGA